jgi:hypothetical protein
MTHSNVICLMPTSSWLRQPNSDLLEAMARKPVEITRSETRGFLRMIFGPAVLCYEPQGKGQRVFRLPNTNDALVLDYAERTARFKPSWVTARVYCGAVRVMFQPRERLDPFVGGWLQRVLRLLRIGGRADLPNAA